MLEHAGDEPILSLRQSDPQKEGMEVSAATEQKSLLATLTPGKRTRLRRLLFEFGPGNGSIHKADESVGLDEVGPLSGIYEATLTRWLAEI